MKYHQYHQHDDHYLYILDVSLDFENETILGLMMDWWCTGYDRCTTSSSQVET